MSGGLGGRARGRPANALGCGSWIVRASNARPALAVKRMAPRTVRYEPRLPAARRPRQSRPKTTRNKIPQIGKSQVALARAMILGRNHISNSSLTSPKRKKNRTHALRKAEANGALRKRRQRTN